MIDRMDRIVIVAFIGFAVFCLAASVGLGGWVGVSLVAQGRNGLETSCEDGGRPLGATEDRLEGPGAPRAMMTLFPLGLTCVFPREGGGSPIMVPPPAWKSYAGYSSAGLLLVSIATFWFSSALIRTAHRLRRD